MNPQLKLITLKEVKEVYARKDYLFNMIINIILFSAVGYIFSQYDTESLKKLFMEFTFMVAPPFAMWIVSFPFIREKFGDDKLVRRFEALLTAPISLKTVWAGKITSIFLLSYPTAILIVVIFLFTWNFLGGLNPILVLSAPVWIMTLIITPALPMVYAGFASWSILRFTHPKLIQILQFLGIGGFLLVFLTSGRFIRSIGSDQIVNWPIVACSFIGLAALTGLMLFLINRLDKETVTI
jgi:ABC-type Na+ efflux pump permease subunit